MRVNVRIDGSSIVVVNPAGRLTAGLAITLLHNQVEDLLRNGFTEIVLEMEDVCLVDCAGIGEMVACWCKVRSQGGSLKLVHVSPRLCELLELFGLKSVFEIFDSVKAAISSFANSRTGGGVVEPAIRTEESRTLISKERSQSLQAGDSWF